MGYDTYFHGVLEFARRLTDAELRWITNEQNVIGMRLFSANNKGITYTSEKTYDMVGLINHIIIEARKGIPDFGFKGVLAANTDFEPHLWFLKIGENGLAYAEPTNREDFLAFRRKVYPNGYRGFGLIDPEDGKGRRPTTFLYRLKTRLNLQ